MENKKKISATRDRMKEFLSRQKISEGLFETSIGMSSGWVSNIGDSIRLKSIAKIAEVYPDLNIHWLTTGDGKMLKSDANPRLEAKPIGLADPEGFDATGEKVYRLPDGSLIMEVKLVPIKAQAGYLHGFPDPEFYDDLPTLKVSVQEYHKGMYLAFEVQNDSMTPTEVSLLRYAVLEGWFVIGRELSRHQWKFKLHTEKNVKWVIVHKTEGILIKQIIAHDIINGTITIHSLNPKYPDEVLNLDDCEQIFNVVKTEINDR